MNRLGKKILEQKAAAKRREESPFNEPCLCGIPGCYGHPTFATSDGRTFLKVREGWIVRVVPGLPDRRNVSTPIRSGPPDAGHIVATGFAEPQIDEKRKRMRFIFLALAYFVGLAATLNVLFTDKERPEDFLFFAAALSLWLLVRRRFLAAEWRS